MSSSYGFTAPLATFRPELIPTPGVSGDVMIETTPPPLTWRDADGATFTVPVGFRSDGASIPRILWARIGHPLSGRFVRAATLHDWSYRHPSGESRATIDARFRRGLEVDGVPWARRWAMYVGVRAGGWRAWGTYRALDTE